MFNRKKIQQLEIENARLERLLMDKVGKLNVLQDKRQPTQADLIRDIVGLPMIDYANVDGEGYPPHFLSGMTSEERKHFVTDLAVIYDNPRFQKVIAYLTNLFGNHAIRNKDKDEQNLGLYSMNGIKMVLEELRKAHLEHGERNTPPEKFDPLSTLPDVPA